MAPTMTHPNLSGSAFENSGQDLDAIIISVVASVLLVIIGICVTSISVIMVGRYRSSPFKRWHPYAPKSEVVLRHSRGKPGESQDVCGYPTALLPLSKYGFKATSTDNHDESICPPSMHPLYPSMCIESPDHTEPICHGEGWGLPIEHRVGEVTHENFQTAENDELYQYNDKDELGSESDLSLYHSGLSLQAMETVADTESPVVSARKPQTVKCTIPDCMCQVPRCRNYEFLYAHRPPSATSQVKMENKPAHNIISADLHSTFSLASIVNDNYYMSGILPSPREPASLSSTSPDGSEHDKEISETLQNIEPCGFRSSSIASVPFLDPIASIKCDSSGGVYHDQVHDFSIRIPKGAIPEGAPITIEIGVTLYGPFQFPTDLKPCSPIVWLCVRNREDFEFKRPVEISLPHYLDVTSQDDVSTLQMTFLKANHALNVNSPYKFDEADGTATFEVQSSQGTLSTNHFCFLCVAANLTPKDTAKVNYCLVQVQPSPMEVHFCVAYFLRTCIQVCVLMHCSCIESRNVYSYLLGEHHCRNL